MWGVAFTACVVFSFFFFLTPERLHILQKAFDKAKCSGLHGHIKSPPISFASELVGLIARKDISASKHTNKKIKDSPGYFPPTSPPPFKSGPLVTKEKMASLLDYDPKFPHYWSEHPRDKVFGANTNAFSSLPVLWVLHLPSHLPWKHHALSNKTRYKYHFLNTPGNSRSLPYGTPRAGSASMLTKKTG